MDGAYGVYLGTDPYVQSDSESLLALACDTEWPQQITFTAHSHVRGYFLGRVPQTILPHGNIVEYYLVTYVAKTLFSSPFLCTYQMYSVSFLFVPSSASCPQLAMQDLGLFLSLDLIFFKNYRYIIFKIFVSSEILEFLIYAFMFSCIWLWS